MTHQLQAILWDMDGVLVDTKELHFQTWVEVYRLYGPDEPPPDHDQFKALFGVRNAEAVPQLFGLKQATPEFITRISEHKERLFRERLQGSLEALPGVRRWLEYWQAAGVKQALASSAPQPNIDAILAELQARPFFEAIISGEAEQVERSKPAPDVFLAAARQLGVAPANCLVIEDAVVGVQAAQAAHMRCLAVTTTHPRQALAKADRVIDTLAQLPPEQVAAGWPNL